MKTASDSLNKQFQQFTDLQEKNLDSLRVFADMAADANIKLLRKNYEVMGDWVNFTIEQTQLPLNGGTAKDVAAAQMAATKTFSETMSKRTAEYAEIASGIGEKMRESAEKATKKVKAA